MVPSDPNKSFVLSKVPQANPIIGSSVLFVPQHPRGFYPAASRPVRKDNRVNVFVSLKP